MDSWPFPKVVEECLVDVTPEAPTIVEATCEADRTVTFPTQKGVNYTLGQHEGKPAVLATPESGYHFPDGAVTVWPVGTETKDCSAPPTADVQDPPTATTDVQDQLPRDRRRIDNSHDCRHCRRATPDRWSRATPCRSTPLICPAGSRRKH